VNCQQSSIVDNVELQSEVYLKGVEKMHYCATQIWPSTTILHFIRTVSISAHVPSSEYKHRINTHVGTKYVEAVYCNIHFRYKSKFLRSDCLGTIYQETRTLGHASLLYNLGSLRM